MEANHLYHQLATKYVKIINLIFYLRIETTPKILILVNGQDKVLGVVEQNGNIVKIDCNDDSLGRGNPKVTKCTVEKIKLKHRVCAFSWSMEAECWTQKKKISQGIIMFVLTNLAEYKSTKYTCIHLLINYLILKNFQPPSKLVRRVSKPPC